MSEPIRVPLSNVSSRSPNGPETDLAAAIVPVCIASSQSTSSSSSALWFSFRLLGLRVGNASSNSALLTSLRDVPVSEPFNPSKKALLSCKVPEAGNLSNVSNMLGFFIGFGVGASGGGVELGRFRGMNGGMAVEQYLQDTTCQQIQALDRGKLVTTKSDNSSNLEALKYDDDANSRVPVSLISLLSPSVFASTYLSECSKWI